jgi:hypothetical protein
MNSTLYALARQLAWTGMVRIDSEGMIRIVATILLTFVQVRHQAFLSSSS